MKIVMTHFESANGLFQNSYQIMSENSYKVYDDILKYFLNKYPDITLYLIDHNNAQLYFNKNTLDMFTVKDITVGEAKFLIDLFKEHPQDEGLFKGIIQGMLWNLDEENDVFFENYMELFQIAESKELEELNETS